MAAPGRCVEQHSEPVGGAVGYRRDYVSVRDVVDQRDVLVTDPLDVVLAVAVVQHRRALQRLDRDGHRSVALLEEVTGCQGPGRSRRRDERAETSAGLPGPDRLERKVDPP